MRETNAVRLKITSTTLTAADIAARLGLKPDESWKIGDRTGTFGAVQKEHGYALDSTASQSASLADHVRSMIKRIAPVAAKIGEISAQAKVEMACMVRCKAAPPMAFDRDDLRWLAAIGARLDIDIFVVADRPQANPVKRNTTSES